MSVITVTDRALDELKKLGLTEAQSLRITVIPGGCSGMTYSAAIDDDPKEGDITVYTQGAISIIADEGSAVFLESLHIDYSDDLIRSGFRFTNPNASGSCGCGASFSG